MIDLPLPPFEMRELIGDTDPASFDNPAGAPIWDGLPADAWDSYLDFGCGCGRSARRLMQQNTPPRRYVGVDLHRGMVQWCQQHLAPRAAGFEFHHHDVFNPGLNPDRLLPWAAPLPVADGSCTLIEATSVFTHLIEGQAEFYLDEVARVLSPEGTLMVGFFLFEKVNFPFMQDSQNALYINDRDPTNAVVFDRSWLEAGFARRGLVICRADAPPTRGFQWGLRVTRVRPGVHAVDLPADSAPPGRTLAPLLREGAAEIGLGAPIGANPVEPLRAELPTPDPMAVELANAKEYIASLEGDLQRLGGTTPP